MRIEAFGWRTVTVQDGYDLQKLSEAYREAILETDEALTRPVMVIAKTTKGKGVSFLEDADDWHGKPLDEAKLSKALAELENVDDSIRGQLSQPSSLEITAAQAKAVDPLKYELGDLIATRDAYGNAQKRLAPKFPDLISLDGEVCKCY